MKNITLHEFMMNIVDVLPGVTRDGDIVSVETEQNGTFVILEESEYNVMRDAMKIVFALAGAANKDGVIDFKTILSKAGLDVDWRS